MGHWRYGTIRAACDGAWLDVNTTRFRATVTAWQRATDQQKEQLARHVCVEMGSLVVERTPVQTGFLRGSWKPSVNEPDHSSGSADPSGSHVVAAVLSVSLGMKLGDRFSMLNSAAYAPYVEFGTSRMAGRHFVSDTVASFPDVVARVAAELGMRK